MRSFEVLHEDPVERARAAAVRSVRERDVAARTRGKAQTPEERLRDGMRLARFAARLAGRAR